VAVKKHSEIEMDSRLIRVDRERAAVEIFRLVVATLGLSQQTHELQRIAIVRPQRKRATANRLGLGQGPAIQMRHSLAKEGLDLRSDWLRLHISRREQLSGFDVAIGV
jgi:hypothetical protein